MMNAMDSASLCTPVPVSGNVTTLRTASWRLRAMDLRGWYIHWTSGPETPGRMSPL